MDSIRSGAKFLSVYLAVLTRKHARPLYRYAITSLNAATNDSISDFLPIVKRMWFG
jgi:hypothetical protein